MSQIQALTVNLLMAYVPLTETSLNFFEKVLGLKVLRHEVSDVQGSCILSGKPWKLVSDLLLLMHVPHVPQEFDSGCEGELSQKSRLDGAY